MTREEKQKAIDALKISAPVMAMTQEEFNDYIQTLNKVMDWLEQEPTTKNNLGVDCIDRAELLKAIDTWDKFGCDADTKLVPYQDHYIPYIHYDDVIKCIKSMSSVTPQPRKGHWIGHREHCENLGVMPSGLGCYEWCSNCDCGIDVREWHRNNYNFCPNCGADMREVKE